VLGRELRIGFEDLRLDHTLREAVPDQGTSLTWPYLADWLRICRAKSLKSHRALAQPLLPDMIPQPAKFSTVPN
jgi:hypothetical protein